MFTLFFRTLILALIAIVPNLVVGVSVLGLMGGVGISFTDKQIKSFLIYGSNNTLTGYLFYGMDGRS
jgi:hypothetical protein